MEIIKDITDYDILADKPKVDGGDYNWEEYDDHIGNGRFEVLIDMYHEAFSVSLTRELEEESDKIVDRIFDVVCHRDISTAETPGRFLVKHEPNDPQPGDDQWNKLDDEEAKVLVRQALTATPRPDDEPEMDTHFSTVPEEEPLDNYEERKRPRRRSLLRRSATEHVEDNKKKPTFRRDGGIMISPNMGMRSLPKMEASPTPSMGSAPDSVSSSLGGGSVAAPNAMDVILATNRRSLSSKPNIIANNRLQVMLTLQKRGYRNLPPEEQEKVAVDMVKAVCNYWGGRILVETGFAYFMQLGQMEAVSCIKALLTADSLDDDLQVPVPAKQSPPSKPKSVLANVPQPPEFLKQTSMEILNNGMSPNAHNMQSAAVKSLQQRKAKRILARGLGQGAAAGAAAPEVAGDGSFPPTAYLYNVDSTK